MHAAQCAYNGQLLQLLRRLPSGLLQPLIFRTTAAARCAVEHSDECTDGAYRRVSKQAGAFRVHSIFRTCLAQLSGSTPAKLFLTSHPSSRNSNEYHTTMRIQNDNSTKLYQAQQVTQGDKVFKAPCGDKSSEI